MNTSTTMKWSGIILCSLTIAFWGIGCSGKKKIDTDTGMSEVSPVVETVEPETTEPADSYTSSREQIMEERYQDMGADETMDSGVVSLPEEDNFLEGRTTGPMLPIYFDFDKYSIREDQRQRMADNASHIKDNPRLTVRIEGNCDERGTNEYNLALGERRAMSAKKYYVNLGINGDRISTISFGEEKPLNHGHDELAWSQNRRDDFVIEK